MANLFDVVAWCDTTLNSSQFKDYCPNGLQLEGRLDVETLVSSVTASLSAIEAALELKADALLVHHGYFWKGESSVLTGLKGRRIKQLMQADISLIAYHLPLDAHATLGNNVALAELLGIHIIGALDKSEHLPIGNVGTITPMTARQFSQHIQDKLGQAPIHIATDQPAHQKIIQTIGFCTGAAQDFLYKAADLHCDAYLSGEVSERTFHEAQEYGIDYFAAGHHATERYGVQRLGAAVAEHFSLSHHYAELFNPI